LFVLSFIFLPELCDTHDVDIVHFDLHNIHQNATDSYRIQWASREAHLRWNRQRFGYPFVLDKTGSEGDKNEVGLTDFSGFGFTDVAVSPHYKESQKDEVAEFKKKVKYSVFEITNNQMVFIRGDKVKKIGRF
jgi:hypothetical protein